MEWAQLEKDGAWEWVWATMAAPPVHLGMSVGMGVTESA